MPGGVFALIVVGTVSATNAFFHLIDRIDGRQG